MSRPSDLRFRSTAITRDSPPKFPRTPRSPNGVYSGVPVTPLARSRRRRRHWCKYVIGSILILTWTYLLTCWCSTDALLHLKNHRSSIHKPSWLRSPISVSISFSRNTPSFTPHFPTHEHHFHIDPAFLDSSERGDQAWLSMFPDGDGSVVVKNPRYYGLPPSSSAVGEQGDEVEETEIYEVSVVRQLNCLALVRDFVIDPYATMSQGDDIYRQVLHCLDHLRQALLCAADTTLEPTGKDVSFIDTHSDQGKQQSPHMGLGFVAARHTCRNYTQIREWMEANI